MSGSVQTAHEGKNFRINPVAVRSAVGVRQDIDTRVDQLWLDASPRDALGSAVMARVRTEGPVPSAAASLTPPFARDVNHAERNDASAISRSEERRVGKECRTRWS